MSNLGEIRTALTTVLGNMTGAGVQVTALDRIPGQITTYPTVFLGGRRGRTETQAGGGVVMFPVVVVCGPLEVDAAVDLADRFTDGDLSIAAAIHATPGLHLGDVSAACMDEWSDSVLTVGGADHFGVEFTVEVHY